MNRKSMGDRTEESLRRLDRVLADLDDRELEDLAEKNTSAALLPRASELNEVRIRMAMMNPQLPALSRFLDLIAASIRKRN